MSKKSIFAICITILMGFAIVSASIIYINKQNSLNERYQIFAGGNNIVILDKQTGKLRWKPISEDNSDYYWNEMSSPLERLKLQNNSR